jgi:hypothetical protein
MVPVFDCVTLLKHQNRSLDTEAAASPHRLENPEAGPRIAEEDLLKSTAARRSKTRRPPWQAGASHRPAKSWRTWDFHPWLSPEKTATTAHPQWPQTPLISIKHCF